MEGNKTAFGAILKYYLTDKIHSLTADICLHSLMADCWTGVYVDVHDVVASYLALLYPHVEIQQFDWANRGR